MLRSPRGNRPAHDGASEVSARGEVPGSPLRRCGKQASYRGATGQEAADPEPGRLVDTEATAQSLTLEAETRAELSVGVPRHHEAIRVRVALPGEGRCRVRGQLYRGTVFGVRAGGTRRQRVPGPA